MRHAIRMLVLFVIVAIAAHWVNSSDAIAQTPSDTLQPCAVCGDVDTNGHVDVSDLVAFAWYLWIGEGIVLSCGNADGYGGVNLADALYINSYIFSEGPPPRNCDSPLPNRYEYTGTVSIGCQPFEFNPSDSTVKIPIRLSLVPNPPEYCLGFRYDTAQIETFVWQDYDTTYEWPPPGRDRVLVGDRFRYHQGEPYNNEVIAVLKARLRPGAQDHPITFDSTFYPPISEFVFYGNDGLIYRPKFIPSGPCCDECGDANSDHYYGLADAVFLIQHIFADGQAPGDCLYRQGKGDANGDAAIDISDAVYLISYIFTHGARPHCRGW